MNKKGFTLVELLAVIAILAILVIIALPNVMGMFNQAKQNSFTTEVKEIYKTAQQQWISDSMINTSEITYYRVSGEPGASVGNGLQLSGRTELDYYIVIDKSGNVVEYAATDGSYQYHYKNSSKGILIEEISNSDSSVSCEDALATSAGGDVCNKTLQVSQLNGIKTLSITDSGAAYN